MIVELIPTKEDQPKITIQAYKNAGVSYMPIEIKLQEGFVSISSFTSLENLEYIVHVLKEHRQNAETQKQK